MLRTLALSSRLLDYEGYVPPLVQPLLDAVSKQQELVPIIREITRDFGFDTFMSGVSISLRPGGETLSYVFTTMPAEWVAIYDQRAYVEIDPRIQTLLRTMLPVIWDQDCFRGQSARVDEFLDTGLRHGLGSGIAVGFVDVRGHGAVCALNSNAERLSASRKAQICARANDIVLFAHFFHQLFIAGVIKEGTPPRSRGAPLSPRERECTTLAAHGLTSDNIGHRLGIVERTVQFHFDSIRSKLAAATRQEAIAKAVQAGIVTDIL
jgi:DNA-binding CsgD family transcriptional regulator